MRTQRRERAPKACKMRAWWCRIQRAQWFGARPQSSLNEAIDVMPQRRRLHPLRSGRTRCDTDPASLLTSSMQTMHSDASVVAPILMICLTSSRCTSRVQSTRASTSVFLLLLRVRNSLRRRASSTVQAIRITSWCPQHNTYSQHPNHFPRTPRASSHLYSHR